MFRFFSLSFFALLLFSLATVARADDLADAKAAFETLYLYQKTDDSRLLDLFAPDIAVTVMLTYQDQVRPEYQPRAQFLATLKKALARKEGTKDTYVDTKYVQEGTGVRVTSTLVDGVTGKRGPIIVLYTRDAKGELKIKEMRITAHTPGPLPGVLF